MKWVLPKSIYIAFENTKLVFYLKKLIIILLNAS